MKYKTLSNGIRIPAIGLGTWPMKKGQVIDAIVYADSLGYTGIDTAPSYGNENDIGNAVVILLKKRLRENIFITTKIENI
jgi:diketogulonate reductase-like aldo/keto reductase